MGTSAVPARCLGRASSVAYAGSAVYGVGERDVFEWPRVAMAGSASDGLDVIAM